MWGYEYRPPRNKSQKLEKQSERIVAFLPEERVWVDTGFRFGLYGYFPPISWTRQSIIRGGQLEGPQEKKMLAGV